MQVSVGSAPTAQTTESNFAGRDGAHDPPKPELPTPSGVAADAPAPVCVCDVDVVEPPQPLRAKLKPSQITNVIADTLVVTRVVRGMTAKVTGPGTTGFQWGVRVVGQWTEDDPQVHLPAIAAGLAPAASPSSPNGRRGTTLPEIEPHRELIKSWIGVVTIATIHQRLRDEHQLSVSESSLRRLIWANVDEDTVRERGAGAARNP